MEARRRTLDTVLFLTWIGSFGEQFNEPSQAQQRLLHLTSLLGPLLVMATASVAGK